MRLTRLAIAAVCTLAACSATEQATPAEKSSAYAALLGNLDPSVTVTGTARFADATTHEIVLQRDTEGDLAFSDSRASSPLAKKLRVVSGELFLQELNGFPTPLALSEGWMRSVDATAALPSPSGVPNIPTFAWLFEELVGSTMQIRTTTCTPKDNNTNTNTNNTANSELVQLSCPDGASIDLLVIDGKLAKASGPSATLSFKYATGNVAAPTNVLSSAQTAQVIAETNNKVNATAALNAAESFAASHRSLASMNAMSLNDPRLLLAHLETPLPYFRYAVADLVTPTVRALVLTSDGWVRLCTNVCSKPPVFQPASSTFCFAIHAARATVFLSFINDAKPSVGTLISANPNIGCAQSPPQDPPTSLHLDTGAAQPVLDTSW
jgi:hypothetical protein